MTNGTLQFKIQIYLKRTANEITSHLNKKDEFIHSYGSPYDLQNSAVLTKPFFELVQNIKPTA